MNLFLFLPPQEYEQISVLAEYVQAFYREKTVLALCCDVDKVHILAQRLQLTARILTPGKEKYFCDSNFIIHVVEFALGMYFLDAL